MDKMCARNHIHQSGRSDWRLQVWGQLIGRFEKTWTIRRDHHLKQGSGVKDDLNQGPKRWKAGSKTLRPSSMPELPNTECLKLPHTDRLNFFLPHVKFIPRKNKISGWSIIIFQNRLNSPRSSGWLSLHPVYLSKNNLQAWNTYSC